MVGFNSLSRYLMNKSSQMIINKVTGAIKIIIKNSMNKRLLVTNRF
jgi:hypothetical protein